MFVEGQYIEYPHPNGDYYGVSPYSDWTITGYKLYHSQINKDLSTVLNTGGGALN